MKNVKAILLLVLFGGIIMVSLAENAEAKTWWNASFQCRNKITVFNPYDIDMKNTSFRLQLLDEIPNFNYNNFNISGNDIRVTNSNDEETDFYVEMFWKDQSNSGMRKTNETVVWINTTISSKETQTFFLYHCNSTVVKKGNAQDSWKFFQEYQNFTSEAEISNIPGWSVTEDEDEVGVTTNRHFTPSATLSITSTLGGDGVFANPPLPPSSNYTVEFSLNRAGGAENLFWFDGGSSHFKLDTGADPFFAVTYNQQNCTSPNIPKFDSAEQLRIKILSDRTDNVARITVYNETTRKQVLTCNATQTSFGTSQTRTDWSFSAGNGGAGTMSIDDYKLYKNFGWNTTDLDITILSTEFIAPIINLNINNTIPTRNTDINISANLSDDTGLSFCQIITNATGINEIFNFSLSGDSDKCSQNFTITNVAFSVINLTIRVNNSLNNFETNSTLITVANTIPLTINVSITPLPLEGEVDAKGHANYSDVVDNHPTGGNETYWYVNGSIQNEANNSFILLKGNLTTNANITFSARYNDTFNWSDWVNSTTVTVGDITPPNIFGNSTQGKTSFTTSEIVNITVNVTDAVGSVDFVKVVINRTGTSAISNNTMTLLGGNLYQFAQTFAVDTYNIISFQANDGSGNTQIKESTLSFTVTTPSGTTTTTGGGGGGGLTIIEVVNETIITELICNNNDVCDAIAGEDFLNCANDCQFELGAINPFCFLDPNQQCVIKFGLIARLVPVLIVVSIALLAFLDEARLNKLRKSFKKIKAESKKIRLKG